MAPQNDLNLRYPSAQELPSASPVSGPAARRQRAASSAAARRAEEPGPLEEGGRGVCIDRKVFRPLRRPARRSGSAPTPQVAPDADVEEDLVAGTPQSGRRQPGPWDAEADFSEYSDGYPFDDGLVDGEIDILGLDGMLRDPLLGAHNMMRPRTAPARHGFGVIASDLGHWSPTPSRCAVPLTWTPSPKRRAPRSDPVSRGRQMRDLWSRDRFLRNSGTRKFDLRGCGNGSGHTQSRNLPPQLLMSDYVPPHEKRRDSVRLHMRQQMLVPDMA